MGEKIEGRNGRTEGPAYLNCRTRLCAHVGELSMQELLFLQINGVEVGEIG